MHTSASKHRRRPRSTLMPLFLFVLIVNVLSSGYAADVVPASTGGKPWKVYTEWPFTAAEAKRRQAETAKALGLPVEKTLDLGNGVTLELVLIPAGRFMMGTPKPVEPDWVALADAIIKGQIILVLASSTVLGLVLLALIRAWRLRRRPQMSLRGFIGMIFGLSVSVLGGVDWHQGAKSNKAARSEYDAAVARFKEADDSEKPAHAVTLSRPYYMGKYELTQEQYSQVLGTNPSQFKGRSLPVEYVLWDDAVAFCKKVGAGIRLPSEAEWEYACRARASTRYYAGDADSALDGVGWHRGNAGNTTHMVGQKTPNVWGLYDMHGNVCEWCEDEFHASYENAPNDGRAWIYSPRAVGRVVRGGSWGSQPEDCRSASRCRINPVSRNYGGGFRLLLDF